MSQEPYGQILSVDAPVPADIRFQDGALPYLKGVQHFQVFRADRNGGKGEAGGGGEVDGNGKGEGKDDGAGEGLNGKPELGYTYNHAPMLAWWNGRFFLEYITGPKSEHTPPSAVMLTSSADGADWSRPEVLFPPLAVPAAVYRGPGSETVAGAEIECVLHQRMGFYAASNGRFLATGFYGISPSPHIAPNNGYGVGRVVREIREDLTLSEVYFLWRNEEDGWSREVSALPDYTESGDTDLISACRELLGSPLVTRQWREEQRRSAPWKDMAGGEAFCWFTRPDGKITGLYKRGLVAESPDGGLTFTEPYREASLETATGKVWGQKIGADYVLISNPSTDGQHRWPLALTKSGDGRNFRGLYALTPEVPPCRYPGLMKNLGPQYVRGICEYNPKPPDGGLWIAYSMNKEDIWTARIPAELETEERTPHRCSIADSPEICGVIGSNVVFEDFSRLPDGPFVPGWNTVSAKWAGVRIAGGALCLTDSDPFHRARALRLLPRSERIEIEIAFSIRRAGETLHFTLEAQAGNGAVPVRIVIHPDGSVCAVDGGTEKQLFFCPEGKKERLAVRIDCIAHTFVVTLAGEGSKTCSFGQSARQVERFLIATKDTLPFQTLADCGKWAGTPDLSGQDYRREEGGAAVSMVRAVRI